MGNIFSFRIAPEIIFGRGAAEKLGRAAKKLGGGRTMLITDKAILNTVMLNKVQESLFKEGIETEIFHDVEPEPSLEIADKAASRARNCALVIGIGGGSSMDIAKTAAMLAKTSLYPCLLP